MTELISFIKAYVKEKGSFPQIKNLATKCGVSIPAMVKVLNKLVLRGVLFNKNGMYTLKNVEKPQKQDLKQPQKQFNIPKKGTISIIPKIMLGISIICMGISIFYSSIWFNNFLHIIPSIIWALAVVGYAVFAPQAAAQSSGFLKGILSFTAGLMILFSIVSTIAGQYKYDTDSAMIEKKTILVAQEKEYVKKIQNIEHEIAHVLKILKNFNISDIDTKKYKGFKWRAAGLRKRIRAYEKKLSAVRKELLKKKPGEKKGGFYYWLQQIFKIPAKAIEFWLYMFPAVFVDLLGPIGMYIFFNNRSK